MDVFQEIYPIKPRSEEGKERSWFEDVKTAWNISDLQKGEGVELASMENTFSQYPDYKENEQSYKKYSDMSKWYKSKDHEDLTRHQIDKAIDDGKFALDEKGNLIRGENSSPISMFLFDNDAVKGGILARRNGWNKQSSDKAYSDETAKRSKELADEIKGASASAKLAGGMMSYAADPITAIEMAASPSKIVGKTIAGGMAKAFVTEFTIGAFTETLREKQTQEHMARANLDYTLWDSAKNILLGAGLAGTIRGIGSGIYDKTIGMTISSGKINTLDSEILNRYLRREQYKLTTNSRANIELLHKVESDINKGKTVDVSGHTDIDIETKTDPNVKAYSMPDEISKINNDLGIQKDLEKIYKEVDEITTIDDEVYKGMTTSQEADELFEEMSTMDPEIKAELESIKMERQKLTAPTMEESKAKTQSTKKKLSPQAQMAKDIADLNFHSEDEAVQTVKDLFRKNKSEEARFKKMSKADIDEIERMYQEDVKASKPHEMSDEDWAEANTMFAKGIDNLAAGTIAGIDKDENGNITFDAEKFILGLGGYTAVKTALKNKQVQGKLKDYIEKAIDYVDMNPQVQKKRGFNAMVTGTQKIVAQTKTHRGYGKSTNHAVSDKGNDVFIYEPYSKQYTAILENKDGVQISKLDYEIKNDNIIPLMVYTEEKFKRKGYATELYKTLSKLENKPIGEAKERTEDGIMFRKSLNEQGYDPKGAK